LKTVKKFKSLSKAKKSKTFSSLSTYLTIILCGFLISWSFDIYRITFISWKLITFLSICGATIFLLIFYKRFRRYGDSIVVIILIGLYYGGSIATFLILFTNKSFNIKSTITKKEFQVLKKGELYTKGKNCKEKYVIIEFNGLRKQLVFDCEYKETIANSDKIEIEYQRGLLGLYTITDTVFY
jgi:hypothetical protein